MRQAAASPGQAPARGPFGARSVATWQVIGGVCALLSLGLSAVAYLWERQILLVTLAGAVGAGAALAGLVTFWRWGHRQSSPGERWFHSAAAFALAAVLTVVGAALSGGSLAELRALQQPAATGPPSAPPDDPDRTGGGGASPVPVRTGSAELFNSHEGLLINDFYGIDFDSDTPNFGLAPYDTPGLDLIMSGGDLTPYGGADLAVVGEVSAEVCRNPSGLGATIGSTELAVGMAGCVVTSDGHVGGFIIRDFTTDLLNRSVTVDAYSWPA